MSVMVACASRHGSTREIAEAVAATLCEHGLSADVFQLTPGVEGPEPSAHEALILGSAIYEGRWLAGAREFLRDYRTFVRSHPTWLFSSGPVAVAGNLGPDQLVDLKALLPDLGVREHRLFGGCLRHERLDADELSVVRAFGAPDADQRDFVAISDWAAGVAQVLRAEAFVPPAPSGRASR